MGILNSGVLNLSGVKGFEQVPDGIYKVEIISAESTTSQKGSPMLSLTVKIAEGEFVNRRLFKNYVLDNDVSLSYLKGDMEAIFGEGVAEINLEQLKGATGLAVVSLREGREYPDVQKFVKADTQAAQRAASLPSAPASETKRKGLFG